jgi:excisionase family DNA binding protein
MADEFITATEARERLGVSRGKMTAMLAKGELAWRPDPRNARAKLIRVADVEAWLARAVRPPVKKKKKVAADQGDAT